MDAKTLLKWIYDNKNMADGISSKGKIICFNTEELAKVYKHAHRMNGRMEFDIYQDVNGFYAVNYKLNTVSYDQAFDFFLDLL